MCLQDWEEQNITRVKNLIKDGYKRIYTSDNNDEKQEDNMKAILYNVFWRVMYVQQLCVVTTNTKECAWETERNKDGGTSHMTQAYVVIGL
jgi:hypothetical protein